MEKIILFSFYIIIELIYIISCVKAIIQISIYLRNNGELKTLSWSLIVMLSCGIIATIIRPLYPNHFITKIIFTSFFIFELFSLYILKEYSLKNKLPKAIITSLLCICLIYLIIIGLSDYNFNLYNIFFVIESLIAGTISLLYFLRLNDSISIKNLTEDPITLMMLALFFSFGIPLSYTSSFISFEYMNTNFLKSPSKQDVITLLFISRIGTFCYIVFNLFIIKALKCKHTFHIGRQ